MIKNQFYLLSKIIDSVKNNEYDDFCIYGYDDSLNLTDKFFVSDYPSVIDDKDVYPDDVTEKSLNLVYYGEQFADVIMLALEQKEAVSDLEILQALIYYYENDDFLDLN